MKPINGYVVLQEIEGSNTTASGLIITGGNDSKQLKVVKTTNEELVPRGATVFIDWNKAFKLSDRGTQYVLIHQDNILCIL